MLFAKAPLITSRQMTFLVPLLVLFLSTGLVISKCQELHRRRVEGVRCGPVELRFVVKHLDGTPVSDFSPAKVQVHFADGPVDIVSLNSFAWQTNKDAVSDLLFVLPPFGNAAVPRDVKAIAQALTRRDNFRFKAAVLSPDGNQSSFTSDAVTLQSDLRRAIEIRKAASLKQWKTSELQAFLTLRSLPGRHVIIRLFDQRNPQRLPLKAALTADRTLEVAASYDLAPIYEQDPPQEVARSIPGGDASAVHFEASPDLLGIEQSRQMQAASDAQGRAWNYRFEVNRKSAGGAESTVEALLDDVLRDASSTYDLIVQPNYACPKATLRPVSIEPTDPTLRIFGPQAIQMIPIKAVP